MTADLSWCFQNEIQLTGIKTSVKNMQMSLLFLQTREIIFTFVIQTDHRDFVTVHVICAHINIRRSTIYSFA